MKITVEVRIGDEASYTWEFEGSSFQVGRSPESDLQIDRESQQMVSWGHLQVAEDTKGSVYVSDLASTNGSFLNGERLEEAQPLSQDDEISLGETGPRLTVVQLKTIGDDVFSATYVEGRPRAPQLLADEIAVTGQMLVTPDPTLPFGKHKGKTLESCPSSYLKWVADHLLDSEFHEWAVKAQAAYEVRQRKEETGPFEKVDEKGSAGSAGEPPNKEPVDEWYYDEGGNPAGPVTFEALRGMISRGELLPKVSVWQKGMDHWVVAAILPGLVGEQLDPVPSAELARTQHLDPPAAWGAGGEGDAGTDQQIANYWTKALVAFLVNPPIGLIALLFALRVKGKIAAADMTGAQEALKLVDLWGNIAIVFSLLLAVPITIFLLIGMISP